uniref:Uncharacterized protein n=1 Tax=Globisporangium ultimum (strain ATCC 200006 / CBS 805.95 / DAOM BR144) TaxID=431595 RepID=K3WGW9_GLOUD
MCSEVCKISVRSAQKLLDHVNFSPLHKAALEGGSKTTTDDRVPASGAAQQHQPRRVIYDGTKLFWRINETLELCIYEDVSANCVTITAFQQQSTERLVPVLVDLRSLLKIVGGDDHKVQHGNSHSNVYHAYHKVPPEALTKYLLARIQGKKDARGTISLFLAKVHEHEPLPVLLTAYGHQHGALPTDLAVRRRHTIDDVKEAQKEVHDAAVELKKARVQAEHLSNLARISLEAFWKRGSNVGHHHHHPHSADLHGSKHSEWLRVYDHVTMKNAVEHSKDFLHAFEK